MIDFAVWRKAWSLLTARERRNAWIMLGLIIMAAFLAAVMVGSVMPFLAVMADPGLIERTPLLSRLYHWFGFTSDFSFLQFLGLTSFVVILIANVVQLGKTYAVLRYTSMRGHTLSYRLLSVYLGQPYAFFLNRHSGDMAKSILEECNEAMRQFFLPAAELIGSVLTVTSIIGFLLWVDAAVALICFAALGSVYAVVYGAIRSYTRRIGRERVAANTDRFKIAGEALGGIKDVKVLGRENAYLQRFKVPSRRMAEKQMTVRILAQTPRFVVQIILFGGIILLCLLLMNRENFGSDNALGGMLPLIGVFAFAGQRLMPELQKLYSSLTTLQFSSAVIDNLYRDMNRPVDPNALRSEAETGIGLHESLHLKDVVYRYPEADRTSLAGLNITIQAGERIGVVGATGAGKTTLADLILGLLIAESGRFEVDGVALDADMMHRWRQSVGYVQQDIFLVDATIAENIALGVPASQIDMERLYDSARIAQLDRFITQDLPAGYDTMVGERGIRLSGGQRQRIGIARALYHRADLIVFDEATSALDNMTERDVMAAIEALPGNKTIVMIAHRLSTVRICDRIIVMDKGQAVAIGPWDELVKQNSHFRALAQAS